MIRLFAATTVAALMLTAAPALAGQDGSSVVLTFETGAPGGEVMVVLYDSEAAWASGPAIARMRLPANGAVVARFDGLSAGDYGVKAFHDVNGDGEMNTNPFGIPTEPYAFSNNAVGNMGPASWERARFSVSGETAQTISLR